MKRKRMWRREKPRIPGGVCDGNRSRHERSGSICNNCMVRLLYKLVYSNLAVIKSIVGPR